MDKAASLTPLMVIDDTNIIKGHLSPAVKALYHVVYENDGKKALSMIEKLHPLIYIIQLMLSQMDSLEICKRIRSMSNQTKPFIIVVSNTPYQNSIQTVVQKHGADHILFTPLEDKLIEDLIMKQHLLSTP